MSKLAMSPAGFAVLVSKLLENIEIVDGLPVDAKEHRYYYIPVVPKMSSLSATFSEEEYPTAATYTKREFVAERIALGPLGRKADTCVFAWRER